MEKISVSAKEEGAFNRGAIFGYEMCLEDFKSQMIKMLNHIEDNLEKVIDDRLYNGK
jgi:hypothetical protein